MKAAVYEGKECIIVKDVPDPVLGDGEMLLEIEACTVCGVDLRTYRHGDKKIIPPRILGHEFCGKVIESKNDNANVQVGDRVVMYIVLPCGICMYCKSGNMNLCDNRTTMSYHYDGAYAQYMKVPAVAVKNGHLFKVGEDIESKYATLTEPLGCVINAHTHLNIGIKDKVAIIGAGPIGALHGIVSKVQGAQKIYLLDVSKERLKHQECFDFDEYIPVGKDKSHIEKIKELTDGAGATVVIVACGSPYAQADALEIAAKGARVEYFGGLPKSDPYATLNTNIIHYKEIIVSGSFSERISDFQIAHALVQNKRIPGNKIITHELSLDNILDAFPLIEKGESLKVCIIPK